VCSIKGICEMMKHREIKEVIEKQREILALI
jgi:hypothetical protein